MLSAILTVIFTANKKSIVQIQNTAFSGSINIQLAESFNMRRTIQVLLGRLF